MIETVTQEVASESYKSVKPGFGGVYLVVADQTDEFSTALRYACRLAKNHKGHVAIVKIVNVKDFHHWVGIEDKVRSEMRAEAEEFCWEVAGRVKELSDQVPVIYIEEGDKPDCILEIIEKDPEIKRLVLAGAANSSSPGPLISYFTGKGFSKLNVPLAIVPGHIEANRIDDLI